MGGDDLLFEALTPLGFRVRCSADQWDYIVTVKHPSMRRRMADVQLALEQPDEVRASSRDPAVMLFYRILGERQFVCAVTRRADGALGLWTTYVTRSVKEGVVIWRR